MTAKERLNNKFKEVLEKRNELADRMQLQEEAILAAERVMDIFGYTIDNGEKVQEVLMYNHAGRFVFAVRVANGNFEDGKDDYYDLPAELTRSLRLAEYCVDEAIKDWMLEILDDYFEISEEAGTVIKIWNWLKPSTVQVFCACGGNFLFCIEILGDLL